MAGATDRPRRLTDDLAWLRLAFEEPEVNGLRPMPHRDAIAAWKPDAQGYVRLVRLRDRHVLEAAGFTLRDVPVPEPKGPSRFERERVEARKAQR